MNSAYSKIQARTILLSTGKKAKTVTVISVVLQMFFIASLAFCAYSLTQIKNYLNEGTPFYREILFYALFSFGIFLSYCFYYLIKYNEKRWYYLNSTATPLIRSFFVPTSIKLQAKIIYLFTLKTVLTVCYLIFYLLPSVAVLLITLNILNNNGINKIIFALTTVLLFALLITGLICWFASIQQFSFINEIIIKSPSLSITDILNKSKQITSGKCFLLARFKLSFILWASVCVLVIPLVFVVPYYKQSFACIARKAVGAKAVKQQVTKPIVLLHLATETN